MDLETVKALLASQNEAYKSTLEIFLKQTNETVHALRSTVNELRSSLEFSQREIDDLKQEVKHLKQGEKEDKETIKKYKDVVEDNIIATKELEERCNYQEDYSRRNNLQIIGLEERQGETWEQSALLVNEFLEKKLQLPRMELERAHRVGQRQQNRHRPIIARFTKFNDREIVMRNVTKLRGTRIYINEDLCPASQNIRKEKLPLLKQARSEGKVAYFKHTRLIIKERTGPPLNEPLIRQDGAEGAEGGSVGVVVPEDTTSLGAAAAAASSGTVQREEGSTQPDMSAAPQHKQQVKEKEQRMSTRGSKKQ